MEQNGDEDDDSEVRGLTDASLGAERAGIDTKIKRAINERRRLDDLVERDRDLLDERLMRLRQSADRLLARKRPELPPPDGSIARERRVADRGREAERKETDALLERTRRQQDVDRTETLEQRQDTDEQLSAERRHADGSVEALDRSEDALADALCEHAHRREVFAMVAHDLRNPLTVIVANAGLIAESTAEAATREAAEDISRATARMERLLADLLDVARVESGTFRIRKQRQDVGMLLTEVGDAYHPLFSDRGIGFKVGLPAVPLVAEFDHDRIVQMIANLLGNALKFTPPSGTVDLHVEQCAAGLDIVLHDTGPGIHSDALPHVFEQFWKGDEKAERGLGLGLYICKNIAEAHGGTISVESLLGEGATFRVSLPAS